MHTRLFLGLLLALTTPMAASAATVEKGDRLEGFTPVSACASPAETLTEQGLTVLQRCSATPETVAAVLTDEDIPPSTAAPAAE